MTMTPELDPQVVEALTKEAAELSVPVEQLAVDIIRKHLADSMKENEELMKRLSMEYVFVKNAELYERLAK